jgi:hypothetical protein
VGRRKYNNSLKTSIMWKKFKVVVESTDIVIFKRGAACFSLFFAVFRCSSLFFTVFHCSSLFFAVLRCYLLFFKIVFPVFQCFSLFLGRRFYQNYPMHGWSCSNWFLWTCPIFCVWFWIFYLDFCGVCFWCFFEVFVCIDRHLAFLGSAVDWGAASALG